MKRFLGYFLVVGLISTFSIASANSNLDPNSSASDPQNQQKPSEVKKEKPTKYDFSIFRFFTPSTIEKTDSTKVKPKAPTSRFKDETVYEKPLSFFKFSYAS